MTPDDMVSPYIVKTYGMENCIDNISNYAKYKSLLEGKKCMILKKYKSDLTSLIKIPYIRPSSRVIGSWVYQMLKTLLFLDYHSVIHNDVKLDNIFITDDIYKDVVLGDFGYAVKKDDDVTLAGTPEYFSPERAKAYLYQYYKKNKTPNKYYDEKKT
eukprot:GHVR01028984.1.p1 GENE.GHVR01028984.1~~GHVR01028984.1.p1  ORF type:complete len:157 (+),score=26.08 GHVR01028984.1:183-653(+)